MEFKLKNGETENEFIYRVCKYKSETESIDWVTVRDICNKELSKSFGESKYRKQYQHFLKFLDIALKEYTDSDAIQELKKERQKVRDENIALNEKLRKDSRKENILEQIAYYTKDIKPFDIPKFKPIEESDVVFIGGVSDAHFGKEVVINGLRGETLNVYNEDIFYDRMWNLFNEYVAFIEENDISHLHFFDLADSIQGILRMTDLQYIKYGIIESAIKYANFMATWLNELSQYVKIDYYGCLGNHDEIRPLGSRSGEFGKENVGYVITAVLRPTLQNNERITIHESSNLQYVEIEGKYILATHGQDEKNLVQSIKEYKEIYNVEIDLMLSGHLHNSKMETASMRSKIIQFPSIIGIDDFSMKIKKTANPEGKIILIEDNKLMNIDIDLS